METRNETDKRVVLGGVLIVIGALLLLSSIDILNFRVSHIIFSWPFFFTIIGLFILFNTNKKFLGGLFTGLGLLFLIPRIFPDVHYHGGIIIPIILISLGLYIILNHQKKISGGINFKGNIRKDYIDDVSIFGGGAKIISSDNFKGGNITAVFGGSEINLTGCKLAEGEQVLDVLTVFGGTTIIVPRSWNVVVNVTSILGGFSDKSIHDPNTIPDQSRTLFIKGLAFFGGGEVKNYL